MPDTPSVTLIKDFQYRGATEEFSNTYHFSGPQPSTTAEWNALIGDIIVKEQPIFPATVRFVRAYGYDAGSNHANHVLDMTVPPNTIALGTFAPAASAVPCPGDAAATVRWSTGQYNSRGKLIYCRKYFHAVYNTVASPDQIVAAQKTAMETYAAAMISGSLPSGRRYCAPQGAVLVAPRTDPFITTRTLKRRGKRPLP